MHAQADMHKNLNNEQNRNTHEAHAENNALQAPLVASASNTVPLEKKTRGGAKKALVSDADIGRVVDRFYAMENWQKDKAGYREWDKARMVIEDLGGADNAIDAIDAYKYISGHKTNTLHDIKERYGEAKHMRDVEAKKASMEPQLHEKMLEYAASKGIPIKIEYVENIGKFAVRRMSNPYSDDINDVADYEQLKRRTEEKTHARYDIPSGQIRFGL
jgi:hypothetical protein